MESFHCMSDFSGKRVIVTGASTGIGRATALMLGQRGAHVALIARSADKLEALASEIVTAAGSALVHPADVADRAALAARSRRRGQPMACSPMPGFGGEFAPFPAYSDANWDALIATNLTSVFLDPRGAACHARAPQRFHRGDGQSGERARDADERRLCRGQAWCAGPRPCGSGGRRAA